MRVMANRRAFLKTYKSKDSDHNRVKGAFGFARLFYQTIGNPGLPSTAWIWGIGDWCNVGHHAPKKVCKIHM